MLARLTTRRKVPSPGLPGAVGAVLLMIFLGACDTFPLQNFVGVSLSGQGPSVIIRYAPCLEGGVRWAEFGVIKGNTYGDEDDTVLWKIRVLDGSTRNTFTVGETPPGFTTAVGLVVPLEELRAQDLFVYMETDDEYHPGVSFRLEELSAGTVKTGNAASVPLPKFEQRLSKACGE